MLKHKQGRVILACSLDFLLEGAAPVAFHREHIAEAAAERLARDARELVVLNRLGNFGFFTGLLRRWELPLNDRAKGKTRPRITEDDAVLVANVVAPARQRSTLRAWTRRDFRSIIVTWSLVKLAGPPARQPAYEGAPRVPVRETESDPERDFEGGVGRPFSGSKDWFEGEEKKHRDDARIARKLREEAEESGDSCNLSHDPFS